MPDQAIGINPDQECGSGWCNVIRAICYISSELAHQAEHGGDGAGPEWPEKLWFNYLKNMEGKLTDFKCPVSSEVRAMAERITKAKRGKNQLV